MYSNEDKLEFFKNELNDIKDDSIRKFAEAIILRADDYFFTAPASTTGKYHPKLSLGNGGLIRHTRLVEYFVSCICAAMGYEEHLTDLLIVSAIVHDIKKLGDGSSQYTVKDHPLQAVKLITEVYKSYKKTISKEDFEIIKGCVSSHMGRWGAADGNPMPETEIEKMVHLADYLAARKEIEEFSFRPTELTPKPEEPVGDYRITFGKFKGNTLQQIYEQDEKNAINYFEWVVGNDEFNIIEAKEKIKQFLTETIKKSKSNPKGSQKS